MSKSTLARLGSATQNPRATKRQTLARPGRTQHGRATPSSHASNNAINATSVNYACIKKLKGKVIEIEVNKAKMEEKWKMSNNALTEQSSQHKTMVDALDAEYRKLQEVAKGQADLGRWRSRSRELDGG
ncbi:hypothetical protein JCGZ_26476 [Jatropha curcas]|uniref:Uncharacterized protein n=1 Tax=Jatropha curcas TaxID=180498 RepID=A0A067L4I6_JATCU|nr:hypothetical protein JCGZ_26476 [Jatropha curcas]